MISTYRVFQIIMSLILSGFIFFILIQYAGDVALFGETTNIQKVLDVFVQNADNVYVSGIPVNYSAFSKNDFSSCHARPVSPPRINCMIDGEPHESETLRIPLLMKSGESVLLSRGSLDYGWTELPYVTSLPQHTFVFNPLSADHWGLMSDIAGVLPDTSGLAPKTYFEVCDGQDLLMTSILGRPYERNEFISAVSNTETVSKCSASLARPQTLVTISEDCSPSFASSGICIVPPQPGSLTGQAFASGNTRALVYKDPVDLAALVIGGSRSTVFGNPYGEESWALKNQIMLDQLETSARFMERRTSLVIQLSSTTQECRDLYLDLQLSLQAIQDLSQGDYRDQADMESLAQELLASGQSWQALLNSGCETHGSG